MINDKPIILTYAISDFLTYARETLGLWSTLLLITLISINVKAQDIEKHRWKNRILLIKSPDTENMAYQEQLSIFKSSLKDFAERKLVLYHMVEDQCLFVDYEKTAEKGVWQEFAQAPTRKLGHIDEFEVILIGLDGGVKLKKSTLVSKEELFSLIDGMPMRRQEIRSNQGKGN